MGRIVAPKRPPGRMPVAEDVIQAAQAIYLELGDRRSLQQVADLLPTKGFKPLSTRTIAKWSSQFNWIQLARDYDHLVQEALEQQQLMAQAQEANVVDELDKIDTLLFVAKKAFLALKMSPFVVRNLDDARKLGQLGIDCLKLAEVFEGGATGRKELVVINGDARRHLTQLEQRLRTVRVIEGGAVAPDAKPANEIAQDAVIVPAENPAEQPGAVSSSIVKQGAMDGFDVSGFFDEPEPREFFGELGVNSHH